MKEDLKCSACGSSNFEHGKLFSEMGVGFHPDKTKERFLMISTATAIEGFMCTNCGHIHFFGDVKKLKDLVGNK